jgi:glycosidase
VRDEVVDLCRWWFERRIDGFRMSNDWLTLFVDNHDNPRMISKINPDPEYRVALGKLLGTLLLTMRGTPFPTRARNSRPSTPRSRASTSCGTSSPSSAGGGFTTGTPWLVCHDDPGFSVAEQRAAPLDLPDDSPVGELVLGSRADAEVGRLAPYEARVLRCHQDRG